MRRAAISRNCCRCCKSQPAVDERAPPADAPHARRTSDGARARARARGRAGRGRVPRVHDRLRPRRGPPPRPVSLRPHRVRRVRRAHARPGLSHVPDVPHAARGRHARAGRPGGPVARAGRPGARAQREPLGGGRERRGGAQWQPVRDPLLCEPGRGRPV